MKRIGFSLLLLALLGVSIPAAATPANYTLDVDEAHRFDLALVGFFSGAGGRWLGGGVIAGIPVAPRGFSDKVNDAFYIEVEAHFAAYVPFGYPATFLGGGVRYEIFILDWLGFYLAGRGGARVPLSPRTAVQGWGSGMLGFHFFPFSNDKFGFRLEFGYPGVKFGVNFIF